jgi:putative transposase
VQRLCQVFGVHRSSYRAWRDRDRTPCDAEQALQEQVIEAHETSNGSAGARTIASMVTQAGIPLLSWDWSVRSRQATFTRRPISRTWIFRIFLTGSST